VAACSSDHTVASTIATEVTQLSLTLAAGTYLFNYFLIISSSTSSTGLKFGINYTGTMTQMANLLSMCTTGTANATGVNDDQAALNAGQMMEGWNSTTETTTAPNIGPYTGVSVTSQPGFNRIEGIIVVSDGGDLELWHGSETSVTTTVYAGSSLILRKVA
jgi:hypothetical protein